MNYLDVSTLPVGHVGDRLSGVLSKRNSRARAMDQSESVFRRGVQNTGT